MEKSYPQTCPQTGRDKDSCAGVSEDKFMDEDNCEDEVEDKCESCPQT